MLTLALILGLCAGLCIWRLCRAAADGDARAEAVLLELGRASVQDDAGTTF